ncbi:MAG: rod shape-determining protein RodA, partial [Terriglobia bacterium]
FFTALALAVIGIIEIYSTTSHTLLAGDYRRQIDWVALGAVLALVFSQFDYHFIMEHVGALYLFTLTALLAVLLVAHPVDGARRWFSIGGLTFQVSEMAKLVIILIVGVYFSRRKTNPVTLRDLLVLGLLAGVPAGLVMLEPDLGTALTFFPAIGIGVYLAGIRFRQLALVAMLIVLMAPVGWHFLRPYQRQRLMSFSHPAEGTRGKGYQVTQSKIAIGSGGFWGKGLGNGTQSRLGFIPVSHADFIFAAFAEEQGFAGTFAVLLLYFLLLVRLLDGAQLAGDRAGLFFVAGLTSVLFFQVAVNVAMMIGFMPITGIPLPLMSQGGSSVLFTFIGLGLAMSVRKRRFVN